MAFKPNYRRDRAERQRAARARTEEKQRKKEEKAALRKAEREAAEGSGLPSGIVGTRVNKPENEDPPIVEPI
jgi:hypothetical protein